MFRWFRFFIGVGISYHFFLTFSCFAMLHLYFACRIFMIMIEVPFFSSFLYFFVFFVEVSSVYRAGIDLHYKRIIQNNINFICKLISVYMCEHTCRLTIIRANRRTYEHTNKRVSYFLSDWFELINVGWIVDERLRRRVSGNERERVKLTDK